MKRIINIINNISLKNRLVLLFLFVSLIPVLIIGVVSYDITADIIMNREIGEKQQLFNMIMQEVLRIIDEKQLIGVRFHLDSIVQTLLRQDSNYTKEQINQYEFEINKELLHYKNAYGVSSIYLFSKEGKIYSNINPPDIDLLFYEKKDWYQDLIRQRKVYFWGDTEQLNGDYFIPYVRIIDRIDTLTPLGVLIINLRESYLEDTYDYFTRQSPGFYYIVNERNTIISTHGSKEYLGKKINKVFGLNEKALSNQRGFFEEKVAGENCLFIYVTEKQTGWKFLSIVPVEEILVASRNIKQITIFLSLFCIFVCLLISLYLSQRVTSPINKLINIMQKAEDGDLNIRFVPKYNDEIGRLAISFNIMLSKLKKLINKTITIEKEKREAELKVLGFQINPHFLYNTLSSIIWLSNANKNQEVIKLTKSLSNFFRISISRGKEVIKIEDELNHVKNYLEIQKIRYRDEFDVIYDINLEINDFYIPKLVLQPLVENAIYHGIKNLDNIKGIVKLEGYRNDHKITIMVKDNGNSLSEQEINYINEFLVGKIKTKEDFGIGISNVNDRLKLFFGNEYGLHYKKEGLYTIAMIKIPAAREEEIDV